MRYGIILIVLLAGCTPKQVSWGKAGSTEEEFRTDVASCRAQAFSVPSAMNNLAQVAMVQNACLQSKGWSATQR